MNLPFPKLLLALAIGFGAVSPPAALILIEAANTPRPELHEAAYARTLLREARLIWEDRQARAGGSAVRVPEIPEPGLGD